MLHLFCFFLPSSFLPLPVLSSAEVRVERSGIRQVRSQVWVSGVEFALNVSVVCVCVCLSTARVFEMWRVCVYEWHLPCVEYL